MAKHECEAPDCAANSEPHAAYVAYGSYLVAVAPRKAYWFFACRDYFVKLRNDIAMGKTQLVIMRWWMK